MDRSKINRALAKAMAHRAAGNHDLVDEWSAHLLYLLEANNILALDAADGCMVEPER